MHLLSSNILSNVICNLKCESSSLDHFLIETKEAILLFFTKAFVRVCQMHMEYLFRLLQFDRFIYQITKFRGSALSQEEIFINRNFDFSNNVSIFF